MSTTVEPDTAPQINLVPIVTSTYEVPVRGVTPLIMHKWSEKALRMMREKQSGSTARAKKQPKFPEDEAEAATYRIASDDESIAGKPGMPATAFKAAIADAARYFEGVTIVQLKQAIFVEGHGAEQLVPIEGPNHIREDTPRVATGTADLRYRRCFTDWTCVLPVTFSPSVIDIGSVLSLIDAAGNGGVGDWRPSSPKSKSGTYGRFAVDHDREVRHVR